MKLGSLFSFKKLSEKVSETFSKYPVVIVMCIAFYVCSILLYHSYELGINEDVHGLIERMILTLLVAVPLFLTVRYYTTTQKVKKKHEHFSYIFVLLFACGFYIYLPPNFNLYSFEQGLFTAMIILLTWILPPFGPFIYSKDLKKYWEAAFMFFLTFVITMFTSGLIFAGSMAAIAVFDQLIVSIPVDDISFYLFTFLASVFSPFLFLSEYADILKSKKVHSLGKVFTFITNYVLMPLVFVYVLILYMYLLKVLFPLELPEGGVAFPILMFLSVGLFEAMLLYPLLGSKKHQYVNTYWNTYFIAIVPLLVMLFVALFARVFEYGFTELRFGGIVMGVWFSIVSLYFIFSKKKNIKIVPVSFAILLLISTVGPLSASSVSEYSQKHIFENILTEAGVLDENGFVDTNSASEMSAAEQVRTRSIIEYFDDYHRLSDLDSFFPFDVDDTYLSRQQMIEALNIDYDLYTYRDTVSFNTDYGQLKIENLSDYKSLYAFNAYEDRSNSYGQFKANLEGSTIQFQSLSLEIDLQDEIDNLLSTYGSQSRSNVPFEALTFSGEQYELRLDYVNFAVNGSNEVSLIGMSGHLLTK